MADSVFRGALTLFNEIGVYDVVLPFLLVFAIVFAILDKTKVLGTVKIDGTDYPKKSLNAIISFVIAFFVVGSARLVSIINRALANTVLLIILVVFFLVLIGIFHTQKEEVLLKGGWKSFFMVALFIGIVLIFMEAIGWLQDLWDYLQANWETQWVGSLIMLGILIFFMWFITKTPKESSSSGGESEE